MEHQEYENFIESQVEELFTSFSQIYMVLSMAREKKQPRKLAGGCSPIA